MLPCTEHAKKGPSLLRMQVMSICETQYSGASIILISPDSDNLSVLQVRACLCMGQARPALRPKPFAHMSACSLGRCQRLPVWVCGCGFGAMSWP